MVTGFIEYMPSFINDLSSVKSNTFQIVLYLELIKASLAARLAEDSLLLDSTKLSKLGIW